MIKIKHTFKKDAEGWTHITNTNNRSNLKEIAKIKDYFFLNKLVYPIDLQGTVIFSDKYIKSTIKVLEHADKDSDVYKAALHRLREIVKNDRKKRNISK